MMRCVRSWGLAGVVLLLSSASLSAHEPADAMGQKAEVPCSEPVPLPAPLSAWTAERFTAEPSGDPQGVEKAVVQIGQAVDIPLLPVSAVHFAAAPGKGVAAGTKGGMLTFDVSRPGRYSVALSAAAWIDVLEEGKPVSSVAHARGPGCSSIRKMVDYMLKPGRHVLQISGSSSGVMRVMVVKLP